MLHKFKAFMNDHAQAAWALLLSPNLPDINGIESDWQCFNCLLSDSANVLSGVM